MSLHDLTRELDEAITHLGAVETSKADAQWALESHDIGLGMVEQVRDRLRELALAEDAERGKAK